MTTYVTSNINNEPAIDVLCPTAPVTTEEQTTPSVAEAPTIAPQINVGKTSVSELHERAVQNGETLDWVQVSECGPAHCKLFSMKVTMGSHEAIGSGRSKKIAKQVAAQNMLTQMQETPTCTTPQPEETTQQYGPQLPQEPQTEQVLELPVQGTTATSKVANENPVSQLQQVTSKHGLGFPQYHTVCEDGPHVLQKFDIKVKVKDFESSGLGRSKKTAKRNAAQAMLDQLSKTNTGIAPPNKRVLFVPATHTEDNNGDKEILYVNKPNI